MLQKEKKRDNFKYTYIYNNKSKSTDIYNFCYPLCKQHMVQIISSKSNRVLLFVERRRKLVNRKMQFSSGSIYNVFFYKEHLRQYLSVKLNRKKEAFFYFFPKQKEETFFGDWE